MTQTWDGVPMPARIGAITTVILGLMMAVLDGTITNVALPSISHALKITDSASIWIVNAYQLAIIMLLFAFSSLAETISYRKVYLVGLGVFAVTSLMCAQANSLVELTIARSLQGIGAAAMMSVSTALIRIIYPRNRLGQGMAINSMVVAFSLAVGPTLAALILSVASWPWLFAINVPLGAIALVIGWRYLPANPHYSDQRFRFSAMGLNALTFGALMFALMSYSQKLPHSWTMMSLMVFVIAAIILVREQRQLSEPLLPLDLLQIPLFRWSIITSIFAFSAQMLVMVSLPFYFQRALGLSEVATGLLLTPWPVATIIIAPYAGRWVNHMHGGILAAIGLGLFALGLVCSAIVGTHSLILMAFAMGLCGFGFGIYQTPHNHTLISAAPTSRSGAASGMQSTSRLLGQTTGAASVALLFNLFPHTGGHAAIWVGTICALLGMCSSGYRGRYVIKAHK